MAQKRPLSPEINFNKTSGMNSKTEELASLYVLDKLSVYERRAFEDRLETDAELVLLVRELETALEDLLSRSCCNCLTT